MSSYLLLIVFFVLLPCALLSSVLAASKNQQYWIWFFAGLFFGPFALLASSYSKDKSKPY